MAKKTISITNAEADALRSLVAKLNTVQLEINDKPVKAENPLKSFKHTTRDMIMEFREKFGDQWIDPKEPKARKIMFRHNCTNLTSVVQTLETRGYAWIEYRDSSNGTKRFIDRFKIADVI